MTVEFAKDSIGSYDLQVVRPEGRIYDLGKSKLKQESTKRRLIFQNYY